MYIQESESYLVVCNLRPVSLKLCVPTTTRSTEIAVVCSYVESTRVSATLLGMVGDVFVPLSKTCSSSFPLQLISFGLSRTSCLHLPTSYHASFFSSQFNIVHQHTNICILSQSETSLADSLAPYQQPSICLFPLGGKTPSIYA